jgi:hypothetical protein
MPPQRPKALHRNLRLASPRSVENTGRKAAKTSLSPPPAPDSLSEDAAEWWSHLTRHMIAEGTWRPAFSPTVHVVSSLLAEFDRHPTDFSASKLVQTRLLLGDLGLTPSHLHRLPRGTT